MSEELLVSLLFGFALALIFSGYPVAFCLAGSALVLAVIGVAQGILDWSALDLLFLRTFGILKNQVLLAVPFFIFMGTMLEKSRLAEGLLLTVGQLFGPLRGGLALAVVCVGALLAAATGVVGASVVAMGLISLPVMLRFGYRPQLATGVIAATGTLGQIIPPSVVLVVLADQIGAGGTRLSVGDLFRGAVTPGLLLAGMFAAWVITISVLRPEHAPALPPEERQLPIGQLLRRVCFVLLPPLALIVIVLGSIFWGVATPTEAGALGAVGAMVLALVAGRLDFRVLQETLENTTRLTSMVMFLLIGSNAFTLIFREFGGDAMVRELLESLPGGYLGALILINLVIFVLGFFLDFFEISFIVVPILAPQFLGLYDVHPAWFGVMIALNLQTSFLTPPFGFALFYLKGVCPESIRTTQIYQGVVPFIVMQLLTLALVIAFPQIVTWLV